MRNGKGNGKVRSKLPGGGRGLGITEGGIRRVAGKITLLALEDLDGRCRSTKLAFRLRAELEADLGGADTINGAQREMVKRAAVLGAVIADTEARWLTGKVTDLAVIGMLIDRQRRLFESLDLHRGGRKARDATPTLYQYLRSREEAYAEEEFEE